MNDEIILALIEHSSWPLVVIASVVLLRNQLTQLIKKLRGFRAGSIELRLGEEIAKQGFSEDELLSIRDLTTDELDLFLLVSYDESTEFSYKLPMDSDTFKIALQRLEMSGLIKIVNPDNPGTDLRHLTTSAGRRLRHLLVNDLANLLRENA